MTSSVLRRLTALAAAIAVLGCGGTAAVPSRAAGGSAAGATTVPSTAPSPAPGSAVVSAMPPGCRGVPIGDTELSVAAGGRTRMAVVHVPQRIVISSAPLPALIAFHGYSSNAAEFATYSRLSAASDTAGFVAVFPQGLGSVPEWHFGNPAAVEDGESADEAFFQALLGKLREAECVDMGRVFLAGHSQGGGMASHLACLHADEVAGAAIVSGMLLEPPCRPARPVAIIQLHAVDDPVLPYGGGHVEGTPAGFPAVIGAEDTANAWAARDGCTGEPIDESLAGGVLRRSWTGCAAPVVFYRLPSGGHAWPVPDGPAGFDAAALISSFVGGRPVE